jgi:apolipoprotein N-acyltransferase
MAGERPAQVVRTALIQPNIGTEIKWNPAFRREIIEKVLRLTREAPGPLDLVVWPETAIPSVLLNDPEVLARVKALSRDMGVPIATGFLHVERGPDGKRRAYNSAAVIMPDGTVSDRYDKMHLVPFSERFPFQGILPFLNRIDFGQSNFTPGESYVVHDTPAGRFGILICFESLFPEISRGFVKGGAEFLLNITNDAWFGKSQAPLQHASMAVFRAVEQRMGIGRCANTGITMFIDRYGRMSQATRLFTTEVVIGEIEKRRG